ncbi:MAG: tRNA (cytidine(34)-2'-O)-methyltransferase [Clostridiaceae bacterium]|jgi:tRNA (cytidine/uridine-2'-O-)-methyltransferase|nr:tRNA (cytidine(34)-2'-O)-methyltransferase [Clostridiaceae bacterium]
MFNVVLVEPEIPQNTGNIARTCAATGARLHLVEPLGFDISEKAVKRAGLDYWEAVEVTVYSGLDDFFSRNAGGRFFFASTKAAARYDEADYRDGDFILFGKETRGLPEPLLAANYDRTVRIPMIGETRSLNLSNAVAVVLYEALRHTDFAGFKTEGALTGRGD